MPRHPRVAPGGLIYHVINRSVARITLFKRDGDYEAFQKVMQEAHQRHPLPMLAYCVMPTHWHFVVAPTDDNQVTQFFRWMTHTHAMRWRTSHNTVGYGPLYQGRFKNFPIQQDDHLLTVLRYVERNPLASEIVKQAQDWPWSSLWVRRQGTDEQTSLLAPWPLDRPADWMTRVNRPMTAKELAAMELCFKRSSPMGDEQWVRQTADRLGLQHTLRPEGRQKQSPDDAN